MTDIRQSPYWASFMEEIGWEIYQTKSKQYFYLKKLPLFGTLLKAPRLNLPLPFTEIDELASSRKVFFSKIEPNALVSDKLVLKSLKSSGYEAEKWSLHPTKTLVISLRPSEDEILNRMEKDTRYSIRAAQRRGVRTVKSSDLERFLVLYRQTALRKKFSIAENDLQILWDLFSNEGKAYILVAQWNKADIASCLVLHYEKTAYYFHAASVNRFRELFAPYLLIWETITSAKRLGLKELDLEGIYDQRIPSTKSWQGFSHFKKGFGGEEKIFAGSFIKHYSLLSKTLALPSKFLKI